MFTTILMFPIYVMLAILALGWVMAGWIVFPMVGAHYLGGWGVIAGLIVWWIGTAKLVSDIMD